MPNTHAQSIMPTVFAWMAGCNVVILIGTATLGLLVGTLHPELHILVAVFTLIITCLVQTIFFMSFVISGKVMNQAVGIAELDAAPLRRARELKRRATRTLAVVITAVIATGITGAARWHADTNPDGSYLHILVASVAVGIICAAFYRQLGLTIQNSRLLAAVLAEYTDRRSPARQD